MAYLKGSVLVDEDLQRVALDAAAACFILTREDLGEADKADNGNIMRALAVRQVRARACHPCACHL